MDSPPPHSSNGNGNGLTVKELVVNLSERVDRFMEQHAQQHDELTRSLMKNQLDDQREMTDLSLQRMPEVLKELGELQEFKTEAKATIRTMKYLFGGSAIGTVAALVGLWAAIGGK